MRLFNRRSKDGHRDHKLRGDYECLGCGQPLDGAMNSDHEHTQKPVPGDLMMCLYCGMLSLFSDKRFVKPTEKEYEAMLDDPAVMHMLMTRAVMAAKGAIPIYHR